MENRRISRCAVVRIVCFSAAVVITLSALAIVNYREKEDFRRQLEAGYERCFDELAESMRGVSTALQKGRFSGSKIYLASLASEISREASAAQTALGGLPFASVELEKTAKFLSQVGDYANFLAKKDASGQPITNGERASIDELSATARSLSASLDELYASVAEGSLGVSLAMEGEEQSEDGVAGVAAALSEIETQFPEYAGLIYDGPFSEHITSRTASFLEGKAEVDEQTAAAKAALAGGFSADELRLDGTTDGSVPTYSFSARRGGASYYFDITRVGGALLEFYCSRGVDEPELSAGECVERAKAWLEALGVGNMVESYYYERDGVVTINFAHSEGGVVCYTDLIKVSVAADDGEIIGMEARGYIMNHRERSIENPSISADEARANLRDGLAVESERLAIIPSGGEYELFCHEFLCVSEDGERALVYVNCASGIEEQILILVESEAGTLTI